MIKWCKIYLLKIVFKLKIVLEHGGDVPLNLEFLPQVTPHRGILNAVEMKMRMQLDARVRDMRALIQ